jgi:hypothetical protein
VKESEEIAEEEGEGIGGKGSEEKNDKIKMTLLCTFSPFLHSFENDLESTRSASLRTDWNVWLFFFFGFSQSLQANSEVVPLLCQNHVLPNAFQFNAM